MVRSATNHCSQHVGICVSLSVIQVGVCVCVCVRVTYSVYRPRSLSPLSKDYSCELLLWAEPADGEEVWGEGVVLWEGVWEGSLL